MSQQEQQPQDGDEPQEAQVSPGRKAFLVRLPADLHADLKRWAASDLRSLNGQIEFLLRSALRGRSKGKE